MAHYGEPCTLGVQLAVSNVKQGLLTHPRRNVRVRERCGHARRGIVALLDDP